MAASPTCTCVRSLGCVFVASRANSCTRPFVVSSQRASNICATQTGSARERCSTAAGTRAGHSDAYLKKLWTRLGHIHTCKHPPASGSHSRRGCPPVAPLVVPRTEHRWDVRNVQVIVRLHKPVERLRQGCSGAGTAVDTHKHAGCAHRSVAEAIASRPTRSAASDTRHCTCDPRGPHRTRAASRRRANHRNERWS